MIARRWLAAAALVVATAGCAAPTAGPRVATAAGPTIAGSAGSPAGGALPSQQVSHSDTDYDKALRFTRCMSANGVVTADPVEGKPLNTGLTFGGRADAGDLQRQRDAFDKCKQLLPATWPVKEDPKDAARDEPYYACMRQHGEQLDGPDANGMVNEPASGSYLLTPEYQAANAACEHLLDDPAINN